MTDKETKEKDDFIEVHLNRRIFWWNGEKLCNVRKIGGTLETLHLEIVDNQGYVVAPFTYPDKYGRSPKEGLIFPIKESVEWIEEIKDKQALLPRGKKQNLLDDFIEDYMDFCRSEDKMNWIPKKLRELFKNHNTDFGTKKD